MHKMLCVGEIVNTHGVRGELKIIPLVDDANDGDSIYLQDKAYAGNGTPIYINKSLTIYGLIDQNGAKIYLNETNSPKIDFNSDKLLSSLDGNSKSSIFIINNFILFCTENTNFL